MNGRARPRRPRLCHPNHPTCKGVALPRANGKARSEGGLGWPAQRVAPLFIHQATDARHLLKQVALPHANGRARSKGGLGWPAQRVAPLFIHQATIALHLQSIEESDDQRWTRQKQQSTRYKGTRPGWDRTGKKGFDLPHFDGGRLQTTLGNTTTTARHTRELSLGLGTERAKIGFDLPHFGGGGGFRRRWGTQQQQHDIQGSSRSGWGHSRQKRGGSGASDDAGEHDNNDTTAVGERPGTQGRQRENKGTQEPTPSSRSGTHKQQQQRPPVLQSGIRRRGSNHGMAEESSDDDGRCLR